MPKYSPATSMYVRVSSQEEQVSLQLYRRSLGRGQKGRLRSTLGGRSHCLLALRSVEENCTVRTRGTARLCTVPIDQIRGSEGRVHDFDHDFNPLHRLTQERWLGIASVRLQGRELSPVVLTQVSGLHFVRDGHHRISVARALGQTEIEAIVVDWDVDGPLPWHTPRPALGCGTGSRPEGIGFLWCWLQSAGARLSGTLLCLRQFLVGAKMARFPAVTQPGAERP